MRRAKRVNYAERDAVSDDSGSAFEDADESEDSSEEAEPVQKRQARGKAKVASRQRRRVAQSSIDSDDSQEVQPKKRKWSAARQPPSRGRAAAASQARRIEEASSEEEEVEAEEEREEEEEEEEWTSESLREEYEAEKIKLEADIRRHVELGGATARRAKEARAQLRALEADYRRELKGLADRDKKRAALARRPAQRASEEERVDEDSDDDDNDDEDRDEDEEKQGSGDDGSDSETEGCCVCHSVHSTPGDNLVFCGDGKRRGCDKGWHQLCHSPNIAQVPEDDWFCSACAPSCNSIDRKRFLWIVGRT